jgi:multidrug efflux pump subunit AcrB
MDMSSGMRKQIPISSVSKISYGNSYGGIKRKDLKRVITLSSNVVDGYNTNEVVQQIQQNLDGLPVPEECEIKMTGEQEEQAETASFLNGALLSAFGLIFLILVTQFNSISKPFIILTEILFSVIGVLLGYSISGMEISIIMSGVGIVSLAGIVVKNGILLVEFTDELRKRGLKTRNAIIEAGVTRLGPVLLTAIATMLGLFPLAIGMNFNFITLFSEFNPHFFLGGESVVFWGPLAWTIIFGLGFATLITLIIVPVMYYLNHVFKVWLRRKRILSNKTAL